jgi:cellulose synthase/poly-beta-1,6-N-acetylglucosamine synthase-like glycosyltransferase
VYNERYVIERLMDAVAELKWATGRLEIQVLDDSDDDTSAIIAQKTSDLQSKGIDVFHIRRSGRDGYKAGALMNGLETARGEFIAIFDADFIPKSDFLIKTIPHFSNGKVGMVQVKWAHLNKGYSLLTRLQAFALDGHFSVEQTGRSSAGSFINFNGTAGIWRKACIIDAGGWQEDTIAEDLDLSYRAQLKGWKFRYLENIDAPAELPVVMSAVKTQQFRWNKGGAESARKNLIHVLVSRMRFVNKVHAFFHLTNSMSFLFLLIASVVSIPLLFVKYRHPQLGIFFDVSSIFILGFMAISYFYWVATKYNNVDAGRTYLKYYPVFMTMFMGLTFHNSVAVVEGWMGRKTPFVRTPKFSIVGQDDRWKSNHRFSARINAITIMEGILCLYFLLGIVIGLFLEDYGLILFHFLLAAGYAFNLFFSLRK